ncbi:MAG: hypothetical protein HYW78_03900 [Parcubacteria group bacterium]|nr:hypothetical protein [Parcubacteria group bacterium]
MQNDNSKFKNEFKKTVLLPKHSEVGLQNASELGWLLKELVEITNIFAPDI